MIYLIMRTSIFLLVLMMFTQLNVNAQEVETETAAETETATEAETQIEPEAQSIVEAPAPVSTPAAQLAASSSVIKEIVTEEITVPVGLDKVLTLDFDFSPQLSLSDGNILRVEPDLRKKEITLIGLKAGKTALTIRNNVDEPKLRYIIDVTSDDQSKTVAELKDLIGDVEGIEIGIRGGRIFVGGQIVVPNDIKRVASVLESFSSANILRLIEMSPQTQLIIAKEMQEEIQKNNFKSVTVRVVNRAFWVEGSVSSQDEANVIREITKAYLPEKIEAISSSSISAAYPEGRSAIVLFLGIDKTQKQEEKPPLPKQIKINSQFVELKKDYNKVFGFKWSPLMSDDGSQVRIGEKQSGDVATSSQGAFSAVISNLFPRLNSLRSAGYGRVVQSGMVIAKEKQAAEVTRQTEIPTQTLGSPDFSRPVTARSGLSMVVTPSILEDNIVNMNIKINVKAANPVGASGVISETTNSISTEMFVKSGDTAALGGVLQTQDTNNYDRDDPAPIASGTDASIPRQLFGILRSKSHNQSKNQYVIFITPEIIASASDGVESIKNKFRRRSR